MGRKVQPGESARGRRSQGEITAQEELEACTHGRRSQGETTTQEELETCEKATGVAEARPQPGTKGCRAI